MLKKFLGEVMIIVAGKQAENLAVLLDNKKYVNEFTIAKKMDLTINQTRNLLYKISDYGLISFIRKKDKKKGWYTYFWKIEFLKSLEFLKEILVKKIDQLNHQVKSRETKRFYFCARCNIELNEENALLHDFTCNECGDIFAMKDNTRMLRELNRALDKLKRELKSVEDEIEIEEKKLEKQKLIRLKKEEKIKADEKAKKKLEREILKKKNSNEKPKKVSKKEDVKTPKNKLVKEKLKKENSKSKKLKSSSENDKIL
jgi:transcription factor E